MKRMVMFVVFLTSVSISSCDFMDKVVDTEGCVSKIEHHFSAGGFASADIRETTIRFTDGRVVSFAGIYNQFIEGHCYQFEYWKHCKKIIKADDYPSLQKKEQEKRK